MNRTLRCISALLRFFTTIPLGSEELEDVVRGFPAIPLVGVIEGLLVSSSIFIATYLGMDIGAAAAVALHVAVTGGLHLDGFADYIDGRASAKRGEEMLKIMKDPRKGTFAIIGITLNILLSYVCMKTILALGYNAVPYIVSIYIASTQSMYVLAYIGKKPPYQGLGAAFIEGARRRKAIALNAGIVLVLLGLYLLFVACLIPIAALSLSLLIPLLVERDARHRLGFVNGDVLGYCYELTKVCAMLFIVLMMKLMVL